MKKNTPVDSLNFFYDDTFEDYASSYFIKFDYEHDNCILTQHNCSFDLQDNGSIMLYFQADIFSSSKIAELVGLVYPRYNGTGIYGDITFFNDEFKNIYDNYPHNIKFYPIGHFVYNFDTNSFEEYMMSGLNLFLEV